MNFKVNFLDLPSVPFRPQESESHPKWMFFILKTYQTTSLVSFCDTDAGVEASFQMNGNTQLDRLTEGQTDMKVEIIFRFFLTC